MRKRAPLIVANWKAFIATPKEGIALFKKIEKTLPRRMRSEVVVCPPAILLAHLAALYRGTRIVFGIQRMSVEAQGAHTGEITGELARAAGASYAIVGHAECRAKGDDDAQVAREARAALDAGIIPIICVGEAQRDREGNYFAQLEKSLAESVSRIRAHEVGRIVIAYEPVWAIGAPTAPGPRVVAEATLYVRKTLATLYGRDAALKARILYGGAVDGSSAEALISEGHINGFLVGRASVDPDVFGKIIAACEP